MTALGLKSLWARKFRALATTFAVVLGVAFVAGSYVLTDTIFAAFDEIFSESLKGTSVVITAENPVKQDNGEIPTVSASLLSQVQRTAGVKLAAGAIFTRGGFFDAEGNKIGNKFAPKFISSTLPDGLESLTYLEGHKPRGPTEASLDKAAAESSGLELGERIRLIGQGRARSFRLVGFTRLGGASFGGASIAQVTLPVAQQLTHKADRFDQISVAADKGVAPEALRRRIAAEMPGVKVETAQESADRDSEEIRENLGFLQTFLLVFGFIAILVGSFLIFNTFSITVAQRVTEFGMLRTLGASRRQILTEVVVEALAIGLLGALIGIGGGFLAAMLLNALLELFEIDLPTTGLVMEQRTVVVSLIVGVVVTVLASLVPAVRSTRVPPIAALQAYTPPATSRRRLAFAVVSVLLATGGLAMVLIGLFGSASAGTAAGLIGGGAVIIVFAVSLFSPRLVRPLAAVAGWPLERFRRLLGRLARENAQRNPSRTAVTAAALMIGLALVTFVTVFAAGLKSSVAQVVDENFAGGLVIQNSDGFSPIPSDAATAARRTPGVASVETVRSAQAKVIEEDGSLGSKVVISAPSPDIGDAIKIEWKPGGSVALGDISAKQVFLSESFASDRGLEVGSSIELIGQKGRQVRFEVVGEFSAKLEALGSVLMSKEAILRGFGQTQDTIDFVEVEPGADPTKVQALLTRGAEVAFPTTEVLNQQELKESREEQVDQLVHLIYALLAMAILISLFGIANTLALSIHERTRELGMLRAIGMSRRQVRTMIRYEAVITALIGAILGMVLGLIFAALIAQPLKDEGFTLSYPVVSLVVLLALSALAGVLSAIAPARRASRLKILESLQYE